MAFNEPEDQNAPEVELHIEETPETLPVGIARIRDEWRAAGLVEEPAANAEEEIAPVVFPEVEGGAGIGDYTLSPDAVQIRLALSKDAIHRLIHSGELDSILVQGPEGKPRRLLSEASVSRFQTDSAIDPDAIKHAAKAMADAGVSESIQELQEAIEELKGTQGKLLQQTKDMLLLEIRNLKEQDRDLTSFVYELANDLKDRWPKKR